MFSVSYFWLLYRYSLVYKKNIVKISHILYKPEQLTKSVESYKKYIRKPLPVVVFFCQYGIYFDNMEYLLPIKKCSTGEWQCDPCNLTFLTEWKVKRAFHRKDFCMYSSRLNFTDRETHPNSNTSTTITLSLERPILSPNPVPKWEGREHLKGPLLRIDSTIRKIKFNN